MANASPKPDPSGHPIIKGAGIPQGTPAPVFPNWMPMARNVPAQKGDRVLCFLGGMKGLSPEHGSLAPDMLGKAVGDHFPECCVLYRPVALAWYEVKGPEDTPLRVGDVLMVYAAFPKDLNEGHNGWTMRADQLGHYGTIGALRQYYQGARIWRRNSFECRRVSSPGNLRYAEPLPLP